MITMTQLERRLEVCLNKNIPVMVWGPPGVGKSDVVRQIARKRGWGCLRKEKKPKFGFIDFRATLRDPVDLRGLPLVDSKSNTTRWLAPNELPQAERDGDEGILFMDELPQASQAMQAACFSLVLDRYIGEYHLPPGWRIIAAGNRTSDRSGASRMLKALANRFAHNEVVVDVDAWAAWAARVNLHPLVAAFIRFRPNLLHQMPDGEENCFPTPRAWEKVALVADEKDEGLRLGLVTSIVGEGAAVEFEGFVRVWSRVPSLEQIFRDPKSVHVPDMGEPALMYAVASAVSRRVGKPTLANALTYMRRLPKEFEVMCAVDAVRRDPELKQTKAFGDWYANNAEVLL